MQFDPFFGPVFPEIGWIPSIRYLMRRARLLDLFEGLPKCTVLEIGCGSGAFLSELAHAGFQCNGLESSESARTIAQKIIGDSGLQIPITKHLEPSENKIYDLVCAFDVLEHIEDDIGALEAWKRCLKPGGLMLISVPAHTSRWNSGDVWAGHYSRYDAVTIKKILRSKKMQIVHFECYGFPAANISEWVGRRVYTRLLKERENAIDRAQATALSGVQRTTYGRIYRFMKTIPGKIALRTCYYIQELFASTDLGSGYIVIARNNNETLD